MLSRRFTIRALGGLALMLTIGAFLGINLLLMSKEVIFSYSFVTEDQPVVKESFPVGVNPVTKVITENPFVNQYYSESLASAATSRDNWWNKVAAVFANKSWYQNLASPVSRIIVIWPGERKEEATKHIGDILGWNKEDREFFQELVETNEPPLTEGKYFPGQYVAHKGATPADIQQLINESFRSEVLERYTPEVSAQVPLDTALIIASLLEREASDFTNMREVSGVIWNRLFIDMPLQLDATLQYVKANNTSEPSWWPIVRPNDKYLTSDYNTYKNTGLPPSPIANPDTEAVLAALNPIATDCLYYFHSDDGSYYCSVTYEEHVTKLRSLYGRGS